MVLFGFANCGRLDSKYLPTNTQPSSINQQQRYYGNQPAFSGSQDGSNYGSEQVYSGTQKGPASTGYNGPIDKAANDVPIVRLDNNNDGESYNYALETGNGISAQEEGDARGEGTKAHGGFSYTAPDGQEIQIQYTADENGFLAQGSHVPVAPPVPEEILKAVEQNLADEARGIFDDGQYRTDDAGQYKHDGSGQYNHDDVAGIKAAGPSGQINAGVSGSYNAGFPQKFGSDTTHKSNQDGYRY